MNCLHFCALRYLVVPQALISMVSRRHSTVVGPSSWKILPTTPHFSLSAPDHFAWSWGQHVWSEVPLMSLLKWRYINLNYPLPHMMMMMLVVVMRVMMTTIKITSVTPPRFMLYFTQLTSFCSRWIFCFWVGDDDDEENDNDYDDDELVKLCWW